MVIDSSAIIAIVNREEETLAFLEAMRSDGVRLMSVATRFEIFMATSRHPNPNRLKAADELIREFDIEIAPVLEEDGWRAREAWRKFGRGRHAASLNFGDCFAYALAQGSGEPLLYKGQDFAQTDVRSALAA